MRWGQAKHLWDKWDAAVDSGTSPAEFLCNISDESLIQLLLTGPPEKSHERDIVATEAFNRMLRTRRRIKEVDEVVGAAVDRLNEAVERARPAVHATERIAKREKKGEVSMMDREQAIDVAHEASERIEEVRALRDEAQKAADELRKFREERLRVARGEDQDAG